MLDDARKPALLFLAFCGLITSSLFLLHPVGIQGVAQVLFFFSQFFFLATFVLAARLSNLIARVNTPEILAIEVIRFVNDAKTKNLLPLDDNTLVEKLLKSEMFNASEREFVENYVATHLIEKGK